MGSLDVEVDAQTLLDEATYRLEVDIGASEPLSCTWTLSAGEVESGCASVDASGQTVTATLFTPMQVTVVGRKPI